MEVARREINTCHGQASGAPQPERVFHVRLSGVEGRFHMAPSLREMMYLLELPAAGGVSVLFLGLGFADGGWGGGKHGEEDGEETGEGRRGTYHAWMTPGIKPRIQRRMFIQKSVGRGGEIRGREWARRRRGERRVYDGC